MEEEWNSARTPHRPCAKMITDNTVHIRVTKTESLVTTMSCALVTNISLIRRRTTHISCEM